MDKKQIKITVYIWAGEKFGLKIKKPCPECDLNIQLIKSIKRKELDGKPLVIEVKPWLTHLWSALKKGGWHAPVILINGKLFSQGKLINRQRLVQRLLTELDD